MKVNRKKGVKKFRIVEHNRKVLVAIIVLVVVLIGVICYIRINSIDSFEKCVAAGNPVMESYPRQCRDSITDKTFVEIIDDSWRVDDIELMQHESERFYSCFGCTSLEESHGLCVDPLPEMRPVEETSERYCSSEFEVIEIIGGDQDEHGCYLMAGYTYNETMRKCVREWEEKLKTYCTEEDRTSDMCTFLYDPVCANTFELNIKPETKSNGCVACQDESVEYYINGECEQ